MDRNHLVSFCSRKNFLSIGGRTVSIRNQEVSSKNSFCQGDVILVSVCAARVESLTTRSSWMIDLQNIASIVEMFARMIALQRSCNHRAVEDKHHPVFRLFEFRNEPNPVEKRNLSHELRDISSNFCFHMVWMNAPR